MPAPTPEQVNQWLDEKITPILAKYGATEVGRFPDAHLKVDDFERFIIFSFTFKGEKIELSGTAHPEQVDSLLKHWDRIDRVYHTLDGTTDPFHSDVWTAFKGEFGRGTKNQLAYELVCNRIRNSGRRLWTD